MNRLVSDLRSSDSEKAERAARLLAERRDEDVLPHLLELVVGENTMAMFNALRVLPSFGENEAVCKFLVGKLRTGSQRERECAAFALKDAPQPGACPELLRSAANDESEAVRIWSLHALSALGQRYSKFYRKSIPLFVRAAGDMRPGIRSAGFECLSLVQDGNWTDVVGKSARDPDSFVRMSARHWMQRRVALKRRPRRRRARG